MGHSESALEAAGKFTRLAGEIRQIPRDAVGASALHVKKTVLGVAPARLSNVGKRGAKLGVSYTIGTSADGDTSARVKATGPWQLVEHVLGPHVIPRQRARRGRRSVVLVPGVGYRARVQHPGVKHPKRPWAKGVALAKPGVQLEFRRSLPAAIGKVF